MSDKVEQLRQALLIGSKLTTRQMCEALGWQGGTIHQVSEITGLSVSFLLDSQK